jgi:hypothetical protein
MDDAGPLTRNRDLDLLRRLEERILWLACWTVHNANHLRPSRDGLKVGGHQASSASMTTLMTALYLGALRPQDRVAVKPHASPVFTPSHLYGRQSLSSSSASEPTAAPVLPRSTRTGTTSTSPRLGRAMGVAVTLREPAPGLPRGPRS